MKYEHDIKTFLNMKGISYVDMGNSLKFKCINPYHTDHNPSCHIDLDTGLWHCFACGAKGNIITLQKLLFGKVLDGKYNDVFSVYTKEKHKKIKYPSIKVIGKLKNPMDNDEVMKFLNSIGITSEEFINKYNLSYCDYVEMISEDLYNEGNFTKMSNRIVTPITHNGKIINMECRTFIGEKPKVKYVKGGSVDTLFNWENIDTSKRVIVVESVKNFSKLWNVYPNSVAMFHAIPTKKQLRMLNECEEICLFADNDDAGRISCPSKIKENYNGKFYITYDRRKYDVIEDGKIKTKGYDCNDCTLDEISNHLDNARIYNSYENDIFTW